MKNLILLITTLISSNIYASTVTFDNISDGQLGTYIEHGFQIYSGFNSSSHIGNYASSGIGDLTSNTTDARQYIALEMVNGGTFILDSFDFSERRGGLTPPTFILLTGFLNGTQIFSDGIAKSQAGWLTSYTTGLPSSATIDEIRWSADQRAPTAFTLDNLNITKTVSAVPAPAALWLFGSGLIGLIGVRRKASTFSA